MDNATSHHVVDLEKGLKNTKLQFFPANTTSRLQPLDQGIIRSWKAKYKHLLLSKVVSNIDSGRNATEIAKSINILDVCRWAASAWDNVTAETITNCFKKAGFHQNNPELSLDEEDEDELPLARLVYRIPEADISASEYLEMEDAIPCTEEFQDDVWEDQILAMYQDPEIDDDFMVSEESGDDEEVSEITEEVEISHKEALDCLQKLRSYSISKCPQLVNDVLNMQSKFDSLKLDRQMSGSQPSLDKYFSVQQ